MYLLTLRAKQSVPNMPSNARRKRLHRTCRCRRQWLRYFEEEHAGSLFKEKQQRYSTIFRYMPESNPPDRCIQAKYEIFVEATSSGITSIGAYGHGCGEGTRNTEGRKHSSQAIERITEDAVRANYQRSAE